MQATAESFGAAPGKVTPEASSQSVSSSTYPAGCAHCVRLTAASPSPASAQSCPDGRVDRIEFDRSKPFLSETEAGGGLVHSVQRLMNRFHVRTLETIFNELATAGEE